MKTRLRSVYANGDAATRLLRHRRRSYVFVALLCHFYIKSEVYSSGNKELASLIHNYLCMVLKLLQIIRPSECNNFTLANVYLRQTGKNERAPHIVQIQQWGIIGGDKWKE